MWVSDDHPRIELTVFVAKKVELSVANAHSEISNTCMYFIANRNNAVVEDAFKDCLDLGMDRLANSVESVKCNYYARHQPATMDIRELCSCTECQ